MGDNYSVAVCSLQDTSAKNKMLNLFFSRWEGEGDTEVGKDKETGKVLVKVNPKFYRPTEVVS